ncbi:hypothetical protein OFAG_02133 [Oxalobacter formigenes HOxBLS]|uniref:Uncharacterized protein n=1 Tax=Oxalobacter paraformigenes TaxID=556268 RepID=T5LQ09_9BURK|nr:hypothetical protein OFAG_02133 [Oxalobacter paraformigenes]
MYLKRQVKTRTNHENKILQGFLALAGWCEILKWCREPESNRHGVSTGRF